MSKNLIPRENLKLQFDPEWEKAARAGADPNVVWAFDEMGKVVVASDGCGCFEGSCPVCCRLFRVPGRTPQPLRRAILNHLLRNSPAGVEYAHCLIGDRFRFGKELYEVFEEPHHPLVTFPMPSLYVKAHTFFVVLRRLNDGRFFKTLPNQPGALKQIRRPDTTSLSPRRKIPYFRLVDRLGYFVFDTDDPSLAASAANRLAELWEVRFSHYIPYSLIAHFNMERASILQAEKEAIQAAREAGRRFAKHFSIGMRQPWPPEGPRGEYRHNFNIISARGDCLCSTEAPARAARFWRRKDTMAQAKAGLVISGAFEGPEEITELVHAFDEALLNAV